MLTAFEQSKIEDKDNNHAQPETLIFTRENGDTIAYYDTKTDGKPLVMIHGNSASKEIFAKQLEAFKDTNRVIGIDLPCHGESGPATDYTAVCSTTGYADAIVELLTSLNIENATYFGWSLGGNLGIELESRKTPLFDSFVLMGSPPINLTFSYGFNAYKPSWVMMRLLSKRETFTDEEANSFVGACGIDPKEVPFFVESAKLPNTGEARYIGSQSVWNGNGGNQLEYVLKNKDRFTFIFGEKDKGMNVDYLNTKLPNMNVIRGAGHLAFWTHHEEVNLILESVMENSVKEKLTV